MTESLIFTRVSGDEGPPFTVQDEGFDATGWTITMRVTKPSGLEYTRTAIIDDVGDPGQGVPARYRFPFVTGDLTEGDQLLDLHYTNPAADDFTVPAGFKFTLRVRSE